MSKARKTARMACFIDGQFNDPKTCPRSIEKPRSDKLWCSKPKCKGFCEGGYGFAGGYGLGSYTICRKCSTIHDFTPDSDD